MSFEVPSSHGVELRGWVVDSNVVLAEGHWSEPVGRGGLVRNHHVSFRARWHQEYGCWMLDRVAGRFQRIEDLPEDDPTGARDLLSFLEKIPHELMTSHEESSRR